MSMNNFIRNNYKPILRFVWDLQILRHEGEARVAWVCEFTVVAGGRSSQLRAWQCEPTMALVQSSFHPPSFHG